MRAGRAGDQAAGVPVSCNSAQFLGHLPGQHGARGLLAIGPGILLSIDEGPMMSGPDLADLISLAEAVGGKTDSVVRGGQLTASADTAPAASITAWPGPIFRSARLPCDPLPVPKPAEPAPKVNALPPLSA